MNVIIPIGSSINDVAEFAGIEAENVGKVLFGGPMMGVPACSLDEPLGKRTNALTIMTIKDAHDRESTACIHCGRPDAFGNFK